MEEEYDIPSQVLGEEVEIMCNLGGGIWEDALENGYAQGVEKGMKQGIEQGIQQGEEKNLLTLISKKLAKGKSVAQIADECEETEDYVRELIKRL